MPDAIKPYLGMNPLAWFSERLREVLLQGSGLVAGDAAMAAACFAVFLAGLWVFVGRALGIRQRKLTSGD